METPLDLSHLRHYDLLQEIIEGRIIDKPTRGRRLQMLHDLTKGDGYLALKQAAEEEMEIQLNYARKLLHSRRLKKKMPK